jgi:hypothetical protein
MTDEESYIPYLVLVRFDRDDGDIKARVAESAPLLKDALTEIGAVQFVEMSYDGSMATYLLAANPRFDNSQQVLSHLQSPRSHKSSPLIPHDKVLIVSIEMGSASRLERATSWLRECSLLAE